MKNKTRIVTEAAIVVILLVFAMGIAIPNILDNLRQVKRRNAYTSWRELVTDSEHIVIGKVGKVVDTVKMDGLRFVITEIEVLDQIKNLMPVDTFRLLQTDMKEDPIVKRNDTVLLFLYPFEGPQMDAAFTYACMGMCDGQYTIKDDVVKRSYMEPGTYDNVPNELSGQEIWGVSSQLEDILAVIRASADS